MTKELPSPELLRKLLRYEPETGKLFWRERTPDMFFPVGRPQEHTCKIWNTRYADREALTANSHGYKHGNIGNNRQLAHRVAWALYYGDVPSQDIDHINGDASDNRIANLRLVTKEENMRNSKMKSNNKSGYTGVYWGKNRGVWIAQIKANGKRVQLGQFADINDAIAARSLAEIENGYTQRHGKAYRAAVEERDT